MKIMIEKKTLLVSLQRVQGIVERRNTIPILSNILMETGKNGIHVTATDLEIGLKGFYPAVIHDEGKITFSARKMLEIVRELPDGEIALSTEEDRWVIIKSGKSYFKMIALPSDDFPQFPAFDEKKMVSLDPHLFLDLIRKTFFSAGEGDTRQILNGILFETGLDEAPTKIRLVGTDGHRLAIAEKKLDTALWQKEDKPSQVVIPRKAVLEVRRLLEDGCENLQIGFLQNQIGFKLGDVLLISRLLEGTFPNYQQVIPKEGELSIQVDRAEFEGVLRRVALFSREKTHAIAIEISKEKALLASNDPEIGESKEEIPIRYSGEKMTVGFNARYLLDVLGVVDSEKVTLEIQSSLNPCLLRQEEGRDYVWVVMPLRLQEI
jgi:DNA polymerase-3 subunit beta